MFSKKYYLMIFGTLTLVALLGFQNCGQSASDSDINSANSSDLSNLFGDNFLKTQVSPAVLSGGLSESQALALLDTSYGHNGSKGLRLNDRYLNINIPLKANTFYRLSFWSRSVIKNTEANLRLMSFPETLMSINNSDWTYQFRDFKTAEALSNELLVLYIDEGKGNVVDVSDLRLVELPQ